MKIAIVSDIHANLEALEAVLAHLDGERPDRVLCLGDYVGYGANPNECVERLRDRVEGAVIGNHDAAAIGRLEVGDFNVEAATAARWTTEALSDATRAYLESLPFVMRAEGALFVHATPSLPDDWRYVLSVQDAEEEFEAFEERVCFIGHSHVMGTFETNGKGVRYGRATDVLMTPERRYIVNVPSVGQPRDGDPRAGYALWEPEARVVRHVRLEYDVEGAMKRITSAGLPPFLAERLRWGE